MPDNTDAKEGQTYLITVLCIIIHSFQLNIHCILLNIIHCIQLTRFGRAFPMEQQMVASKSVPLVTAKDLHTLQDGEWVSDAVLACCLALACQRSQNQLLWKPADPQNQARIIFCETHLMQKIVDAHQEKDGPRAPADDTISLARWSMKACDVGYASMS